MKIGIKYCGGCSPRHDRVAAVEYIRRHLPSSAGLVRWDDETDIVLIVSGCSSSCASREGIAARTVLHLTDETDIELLLSELTRLCGDKTENAINEKQKAEGGNH